MNPDEIPSAVLRLAQLLPKFSDGRIDYRTAKEAAALNVFVLYNGKLLLVKRSEQVGWLKNQWHVIAGFLDEEKTLRQKALEEVQEETGIMKEVVAKLHAVTPFAEETDKCWIIHPVRIDLKEEPSITLDWENTDFVWADPKEITKYYLIPSVLKQLRLLNITSEQ